jgi:hypothetical protein
MDPRMDFFGDWLHFRTVHTTLDKSAFVEGTRPTSLKVLQVEQAVIRGRSAKSRTLFSAQANSILPRLAIAAERPRRYWPLMADFSVRPTRKDRIGWFYENIPLDCSRSYHQRIVTSVCQRNARSGSGNREVYPAR